MTRNLVVHISGYREGECGGSMIAEVADDVSDVEIAKATRELERLGDSVFWDEEFESSFEFSSFVVGKIQKAFEKAPVDIKITKDSKGTLVFEEIFLSSVAGSVNDGDEAGSPECEVNP